MGTIASTLNSINSSLLNEIGKDLSVTPGTSSSSSGSGTSSADSVNFSQVAQLFQGLQQLQTTNPADFQKVTADAATQLQQAAKQATDPAQAAFLTNLADKFQEASQSGNLSAFEGGASSNAAHGHHGHHHHGGGSSTQDTTSQGTTTDSLVAANGISGASTAGGQSSNTGSGS